MDTRSKRRKIGDEKKEQLAKIKINEQLIEANTKLVDDIHWLKFDLETATRKIDKVRDYIKRSNDIKEADKIIILEMIGDKKWIRRYIYMI